MLVVRKSERRRMGAIIDGYRDSRPGFSQKSYVCDEHVITSFVVSRLDVLETQTFIV